MLRVIESVVDIDLSHIAGLIERNNKIKAEITRKSEAYLRISNRISEEISSVIATKIS